MDKLTPEHWFRIIVLSIVAVFTLEAIALFHGINGGLLRLTIGAILMLAGMGIKEVYQFIRRSNGKA